MFFFQYQHICAHASVHAQTRDCTGATAELVGGAGGATRPGGLDMVGATHDEGISQFSARGSSCERL